MGLIDDTVTSVFYCLFNNINDLNTQLHLTITRRTIICNATTGYIAGFGIRSLVFHLNRSFFVSEIVISLVLKREKQSKKGEKYEFFEQIARFLRAKEYITQVTLF